jgi:predicted phosphoribosyltransferase
MLPNGYLFKLKLQRLFQWSRKLREKMPFANREDAAKLLVQRLSPYCGGDSPLVLSIPRGAVPMGRIIADELKGILDVVLVRKLGHPEQPELAIGAVDEGGNSFFSAWVSEVSPSYIESEQKRQLAVLQDRRAQYTPLREPIDPSGRLVIVVDDGTATGSTMVAALRSVRARHPKKLIAAVAVASLEAANLLRSECDTFVCLETPADFSAVGQFFNDFSQISDKEVMELLRVRGGEVSPFGGLLNHDH